MLWAACLAGSGQDFFPVTTRFGLTSLLGYLILGELGYCSGGTGLQGRASFVTSLVLESLKYFLVLWSGITKVIMASIYLLIIGPSGITKASPLPLSQPEDNWHFFHLPLYHGAQANSWELNPMNHLLLQGFRLLEGCLWSLLISL